MTTSAPEKVHRRGNSAIHYDIFTFEAAPLATRPQAQVITNEWYRNESFCTSRNYLSSWRANGCNTIVRLCKGCRNEKTHTCSPVKQRVQPLRPLLSTPCHSPTSKCIGRVTTNASRGREIPYRVSLTPLHACNSSDCPPSGTHSSPHGGPLRHHQLYPQLGMGR